MKTPRSNAARIVACAWFALWAIGAQAQDATAGRAKAQACTPCHGAFGASVLPDAPSLAGQSEIYLAAQLKAYRNGKREHEVMSVMARSLSDADIANLAAWFSSIAVEVKPPK